MKRVYFTARPKLALATTLPAAALATSVAEPVAAVEVADSFRTVLPLPGAARLEGVKVAVTPAGSPSTDTVTAELSPPEPRLSNRP